ncbi:MAG: YdiU family protein [Pirellulaceae bacterium]
MTQKVANAIAQMGWSLEQSYTALPELLFRDAEPAKFAAPRLAIVNEDLAGELGISLEGVRGEELAALFTGQTVPSGARTIAQAYAGHQFGGFTMLGDGRALLLGEQRTPAGELFDIQFKGSGPTPFSRRGDGLAALGPMLREYIVSEAMAGLGVPTARSLAVVETGETVYRESLLKGAVLTRVASSHIRVGTFQYLAAQRDHDALRKLADYTIGRHDPDLLELEAETRYAEFIRRVLQRQARLIAQWQSVGFIHGVMNTDNVALCGETIDYGPCAFMDVYHPDTVFSSIDHGGRYAYKNQPPIGQWNLARFAETLLPLLNEDTDTAIDQATELLGEYPDEFESAWLEQMRRKLGLVSQQAEDREIAESLLDWMQSAEADFTNVFDDLSCGTLDEAKYTEQAITDWYAGWKARVAKDHGSTEEARQVMQLVNPAVIPRNHRVEEALASATAGDMSVVHSLLDALKKPFVRDSGSKRLRQPPAPGQCYRTFCGT